jgi:hypothetical protein
MVPLAVTSGIDRCTDDLGPEIDVGQDESVPGPIEGTRVTEAYARTMARAIYFWAWPMVNVYNRRLGFTGLKEPGRLGGALPTAPPNRVSMLTDYIEPSERDVACPNQDVVYGAGPLALDLEPVVVQVPDFGDRFWVYQIVDLRTDSFAGMGTMYGTKSGFYLLVGPDWEGEAPTGINQVFQSKTHTGFIIPRVYMDDTAEDRRTIQTLINQIDVYPLSMFDGKAKQRDWSKSPSFPAPPSQPGGGEAPKVVPDKFWDELPAVLLDAPPLPGEQARYAEALSLVAAARKDPKLKAALIDEATTCEKDVIGPLLEFRNFGIPLPHNWTVAKNGARFGTDYFTRTAVAKSNIFVNKSNEATYFYQDLDASGARLNGNMRYALTFGNGEPPVRGFWSLTLYRRAALLRAERDQAVLHRYEEQGPQAEPGWLGDDLCAGRGTQRPGATRELAAGAEGERLFPVHPRLLAERPNCFRAVDAASRGRALTTAHTSSVSAPKRHSMATASKSAESMKNNASPDGQPITDADLCAAGRSVSGAAR